MNITKRAARAALGYTTDVELAQFFKCTKQAVSNWPEEEPLPEGRQWELLARRPDVFGPLPEPSAEQGQEAA